MRHNQYGVSLGELADAKVISDEVKRDIAKMERRVVQKCWLYRFSSYASSIVIFLAMWPLMRTGHPVLFLIGLLGCPALAGIALLTAGAQDKELRQKFNINVTGYFLESPLCPHEITEIAAGILLEESKKQGEDTEAMREHERRTLTRPSDSTSAPAVGLLLATNHASDPDIDTMLRPSDGADTRRM